MTAAEKKSLDAYAVPAGRHVDPTPIFDALTAAVVGPIKLAAIEAMLWIERPLSPTLLVEVLAELEIEGQLYSGRISYHLGVLEDFGLIEKVHQRQVRGAWENFYFSLCDDQGVETMKLTSVPPVVPRISKAA